MVTAASLLRGPAAAPGQAYLARQTWRCVPAGNAPVLRTALHQRV